MFLKSALIAFCLAASAAIASPIQDATYEFQAHQDMISMMETFDHVFTGIDTLVVDTNAFAGDKAGVDKIMVDANVVQKAIQAGTAKIKASKAMSIADLINILGPVTVMENKVGEIVDTLAKKKPELEKAGASAQILDALQREKVAADDLVKAITANLPMPSLTGTVAGPIAATITNQLIRGIKQWS